MLLADVCSYGALFPEIANGLRKLMKQNVNTIRQTRFVSEMCQQLENTSHRGGFVSTLISTYFAPKRSFALCNTGHPPPMLFRAQPRDWSIQRHAPMEIRSVEAPLGVVDRGEYQQFKTKLEVGDMVLSFSNVLTECRSGSGQMIGLDGLLNRVQQLDWQKPAELTARLVSQIQGEHADNLATSDATILLCRATETIVTWRDNVLAPFRLLRAVSDKTKIE
jgi:sigma-B regulation protein RsbU (phosphoserine phosphatase)